jgi:ribosome biogenesis GTPase
LSLEGIIIRQISGFYDVLHDDALIQCKARGVFRKEKITPLVGDRVLVDKDEHLITAVLPRKNQFRRPAVSNIDHLGIVVAAKDPIPDRMLIDKLIINALINDITPSLIINKVDLAIKDDIDKLENEYLKTGYNFFKISCKEQIGIEEIKKSFADGIVAFAGQSGVGKSSLLNLLCSDVKLHVGELSIRTATGKHTTTHAQVIPLSSGAMVIDTPGFSSIEIDNIHPHKLQCYYSEFASFMGQCRFADCMHDLEPDCVVKIAVSEGLISSERYERYVTILRSLNNEKGRDIR